MKKAELQYGKKVEGDELEEKEGDSDDENGPAAQEEGEEINPPLPPEEDEKPAPEAAPAAAPATAPAVPGTF